MRFCVRKKKFKSLFVMIAALCMVNSALSAANTPPPASVSVPGTFQTHLGAPGNWQPEAGATQLILDNTSKIWSNTYTIPAGYYEYKAAINNSWTENYGMNAAPGGANIPLQLDQTRNVKFYYDHNTHWITDNVNSVIAIVAGSFQTHLGASGNWQPDFLGSWLQDPDGDGIYTFSTTALPAGLYQCKVTINESWAENYGENGVFGGSNITFIVSENNKEVFFNYNSTTHILEILDSAPKANLSEAKAVWVSKDTIAWNKEVKPGYTAKLSYSYDAALEVGKNSILGGQEIGLTYNAAGLDAQVKAKFPHLANYSAFTIAAADLPKVKEILKGQFAVSLFDAAGQMQDGTALQIAGVLDDLYTYKGDLGVTYTNTIPTLRLWAPTARDVKVYIFDTASTTAPPQIVPLTEDPATGVWSVTGEASWNRKYYLYEVTVFIPTTLQVETNVVTDPYSFSLSTNSNLSQIVNLNDIDLKPADWDTYRKPNTARPEDIVIYELHIRDFSIEDKTVPELYRGTYKAFTLDNTAGMKHLTGLQASGLTHIHLLPSFDYATTNEIRSKQKKVTEDLSLYAPDSEMQQYLISRINNSDGFNWGYDPLHYTVPEGGYSTDPEGSVRIVEFREMVKSLNDKGLKVVMDVVYNHTCSHGQDYTAVLDRIVPGYYHRLDSRGYVENSTCTSNTASENAMMEKLIIDSVLTWAKAYKVDAFRFDLMGHHMKYNMENVRDALQSLTMEKDGIDGSQIYIYGEGWNFGEVADNRRGVNATQINMMGTGIGTFNDRMRDALRGGNPTREDSIREQGFVNGLHYDPNGTEGPDQLAKLLLFSDQIRVGLTGNLADYTFTASSGAVVKGSDIDYGGAPAGYTADPQEAVSYVAAHDNRTLFDETQLKSPGTTRMADKVRIQNLANSVIGYSQGVIFYHGGQDFLRSKSMCNDSYNSGDWFNALDFSLATTNWGKGLPTAEKNQKQWPIMKPLLADPAYMSTQADRQSSADYFKTILKIRQSSPLFRLETSQQVQTHLSFLNTGQNQIPGLIVMELSDEQAVIDQKYQKIVVLINALTTQTEFSNAGLTAADYQLHPELVSSNDEVVKTASYNSQTGVFTIPARTAAVFVVERQAVSVPDQIGDIIKYVRTLINEGRLNRCWGRLLIWRLYYAKMAYEYRMYYCTEYLLYNTLSYAEVFTYYCLLSPEDGQELCKRIEKAIEALNKDRKL